MWIARNRDDILMIYTVKPYKNKTHHVWNIPKNSGKSYRLNSNLFSEIKWEDEGPRELILKPIKEK